MTGHLKVTPGQATRTPHEADRRSQSAYPATRARPGGPTHMAFPANYQARGLKSPLMKALIIVATAAAMALALPSLAASAVVTARPAASAAVSVRGWGTNNDGELGSGSGTTDFLAPVKVKIPAGVTVRSIRAGCDHSVALTTTGALLAWGSNSSGQVGDGSFKRRNTPVSVKLPK